MFMMLQPQKSAHTANAAKAFSLPASLNSRVKLVPCSDQASLLGALVLAGFVVYVKK